MNTVELLRNGHLGDKKVAGVGRFKQESSMDCPSAVTLDVRLYMILAYIGSAE